MENGKRAGKKKISVARQALNIVVLLLLVFITYYVIVETTDGFSFGSFFAFLGNLNPFWILGAFVCLFLFIYLEGVSIREILLHLGYKPKRFNSFIYSTSDIYFSAITPSASGGQPASAYFMHADGVPVSVTTAALTFNIFMYIGAIIIIAVFTFAATFIFNPSLFLNLGWGSKLLVILGVVVQLGILLLFFLLMVNFKLLMKIASGIVKILNKLHIVKNPGRWISKCENNADLYKASIDIFKKDKKLAVKVLVLNIIQRVSQMAIAICIIYGANISANVLDIFCLQGFCLLGSNSIPLPGAVGVAEGLYLNSFAEVIKSSAMVGNCMLATRGISYYISFIFSGACTLIQYIRISFNRKKRENINENQ